MSGDDNLPEQQTRWLTVTQQLSWRSYILGTHLLMQQLDRDLRQCHDLSFVEYEVLVRLSEAPDRSLRMAHLAASLGYSRSRMTHTINRMQQAGLVDRCASSDDRRGVTASLTDSGLALLSTAAVTHVDGVRRYLVDLVSEADMAALGRVFDAVIAPLFKGLPDSADIRRTATEPA